MTLPLPGGDRVELYVDAVFRPVDGVTVYTGPVDGRPEWLFTLAVDSEQILGRFFVGNRVWILENLGDQARLKLHRLERDLLPKAPAPDLLQTLAEPRSPSPEGAITTQSTSAPSCANFTPTNANGNVRILFLHSSDVATGINNLVASIVAEFNYSVDISRVELNNFITVADIRQVNDTFDGLCRDFILHKMEIEDGAFQGLSQWMSASNADAAFTIIDEDPNATQGVFCFDNIGRVGGAA